MTWFKILILGTSAIFHLTCAIKHDYNFNNFTWTCNQGMCVKVDSEDAENFKSPELCKLSCDKYGSLWPKPTGEVSLDKTTLSFDHSNIAFNNENVPESVKSLLNDCQKIFRGYIIQIMPGEPPESTTNDSKFDARMLNIKSTVLKEVSRVRLQSDDEQYDLAIISELPVVTVEIVAETVFGARHAYETLSQLIAYDAYTRGLKIVGNAKIVDKPVYPYRGIMIDTSRSFISVDNMKALIDGLSYNKLNVLHWHITDSHSFPLEIKEQPEMTEFGAYSMDQIYTDQDVQDLLSYAKPRGVRIVPEFDQPAHVGNGWNWGPKRSLGDLVVCANEDNWYDLCVEPPCGQLNLANGHIYDILKKIYQTLVNYFGPEFFHIGGDEVDFRCYLTSQEILEYMKEKNWKIEDEGFLQLWSEFQNKSSDLLREVSQNSEQKLILWTSKLTEEANIGRFLDKEKYVIQVWSESSSPMISSLVRKGYKTIFSNHDSLYLDCGFHHWIADGNNWCSPYKGWQQLYENNPIEIIANLTSEDEANKYFADGFLWGGVAPLWTEQADGNVLDGRIWPRGSALAERLWSNPSTNWRLAINRLMNHRERNSFRGLKSDLIQPEYCYQNENKCYTIPETDEGDKVPGEENGAFSLLKFNFHCIILLMSATFMLSM